MHILANSKNYNSIAIMILIMLIIAGCDSKQTAADQQSTAPLESQVIELLKATEIARAKAFLLSVPITVANSTCERSAGGINDFYSEGDYWWRDEENPDGPYIRRDGQSNPDNFIDHRLAMVRLGEIVPTLTAAWLLTNEQVYATKALEHLNAWFVNSETLMNPNMLYAQAIKGRVTGRGIGLIDAYHFVEVAKSVELLSEKGGISEADATQIKKWFANFLEWMTTHEYGIAEMNWKNNHSTCWLATAGSMAVLTDNEEIIKLCKDRFKTILLPNQMDENGGLTDELSRTKPYSYSLFNIDAFFNVAQILSSDDDDLFEFETEDGKSLKKGIEFIHPFVADKSTWPYPKDVQYWEEWPVCHTSVLFAALEYNNPAYMETYLRLPAYPIHREVRRNMPVRHPLIWVME